MASGKGEMSLDLFVSDMRGTVQFHKQDVNTVKFSFKTGLFQSHTVQDYRFCVVNQVHPHSHSTPGAVRRVTLDVDVARDKDVDSTSHLAKQEHADKIYNDFMTVSQSVDSIIEKMDELREKEANLTNINKQTTTTIFRLSMLACLFTVAAGVANFLSLKSFFKRKKLA